MLDAKKLFLEKLQGLNVQYELFVDDKTKLPCISYLQTQDMGIYRSNSFSISDVWFLIKIYDKDIANAEKLAREIDDRLIGFKRIGSNENLLKDIYVKTVTYSVYGYENN